MRQEATISLPSYAIRKSFVFANEGLVLESYARTVYLGTLTESIIFSNDEGHSIYVEWIDGIEQNWEK